VAQLTNSVDESPYRKRRVSSNTQDMCIPRFLLKSNVPERVHSSSQFVQFHSRSVHCTPSHHYSLNVHFNIIPPTPTSSKWSLSFRVPHQDSVYISVLGHACHIPFPSQPPWCYHLTMRSTNHEALITYFFQYSVAFTWTLPLIAITQSIFIPWC
jgi:hypothetical protein